MYDIVFPELIKLLGNIHTYFDRAAAHADQKKYDVNNLLEARLAPDQYNLRTQVQKTCFLAIEVAARVAGKQPPVFEDTEKTIPELKQRIDKTIVYLKSLTPKDFQG